MAKEKNFPKQTNKQKPFTALTHRGLESIDIEGMNKGIPQQDAACGSDYYGVAISE